MIDQVAVVVPHGIVASLRVGCWVDIAGAVGTGHDRWRDAFVLGRHDGEVDADRGVTGPLYGEGLGIVDPQRDPAQAWTQLGRSRRRRRYEKLIELRLLSDGCRRR